MGRKNYKKRFSDFWADPNTRKKIESGDLDMYELAAIKRSISDFVRILTQRNIPVKFAEEGGASYTDGNVVTISADITEENFDSTVGVALHEASHICKTDFKYFKRLSDYYPQDSKGRMTGGVDDSKIPDGIIPQDIWDKATANGEDKDWVPMAMKDLINYIEDRRIDHWVFTTSPGYKGYYHSMYDKHWNSDDIGEALESEEYRESDWNSYFFRIINFTNPRTQLDALPGLRDIWNDINLNDIDRLQNTQDVFKVACDVMRTMLDNINEPQKVNKTRILMDGEGDGEEGDGQDGDDDDFDQTIDMRSGKGSGKPMTEEQKKKAQEAFEKQKDFLRGEIDKEELSAEQSDELEALEESGVSQESVGEGTGNYGPVDCVIVDRLNYGLIQNNNFDILSNRPQNNTIKAVKQGIHLGRQLGRKLKVRSEKRVTDYTRKRSGNLDNRLLAELGFNDRVFKQTETDEYNEAFLHLSVDASGSMGGEKWTQAVTAAVAMAKACSMIDNIRVQLSFRATCGSGSNSKPLILFVYDSEVNTIKHIEKYVPYIHAGGTTPEGLTFQAVARKLTGLSRNKDAYFVNLSDGMPQFSQNNYGYGGSSFTYSGRSAADHTRTQVKKIRDAGFRIISYFIGSGRQSGYYGGGDNHSDFQRMYGRDSQFIDPTNIHQVAKTMNRKFLERD